MEIVNNYFSGIIFTQVENQGDVLIYAVRVLDNTHSNKGHKYIIATVPFSQNLPLQGDIYSLGAWKSVQTRYIPNYHNLKPQKFFLRDGLPNPRMKQISRDMKGAHYRIEGFPLEIFLLNDLNKKDCTGKQCSISQYYPTMNLTACISTYHCVISPIISTQPVSDDYELL